MPKSFPPPTLDRDTTIKKASISFNVYFLDVPTGGVWYGAPPQLAELLQQSNSFMRGITENLEQDKHYKITISIERYGYG